jgi:hypothetical protein
VVEISLTSLVGRKGLFHGLGFGVSPSCDKCGGEVLDFDAEDRREELRRDAANTASRETRQPQCGSEEIARAVAVRWGRRRRMRECG